MADERIWELMARKLAGEASVEELGELDQLLRTNPDLHFSIQAITDLWDHSPSPVDEVSLQISYQQHIARMQQMDISIGHQSDDSDYLLEGRRSKPRRRRMTWAVAASIVVIVAAAWFFYGNQPTSAKRNDLAKVTPSVVSVKNGSKTRIQLPDGTQVWLNAGSRLTYDKDFGNRLREVTLIGEGFFDVVRNEQKPFIIHTTKMDVKVLGTRFNVRSYPNDKTTEAALIHGSIEVSLKDRPSEKIILKPNEKIVVDNRDTLEQKSITHHSAKENAEPLVAIKHLTYQSADSTIVETSWVDNKLSFVNESFSELAPRMERWYGVSIRFKETSLDTIHFTGTFTEETIEEAMKALTITEPFNYKFQGKTILVSR
jgi:ferric-dicitrate binding protein FerR (iron transport regulator)